jgi:uncharacterized cupredoxin-like copper-binding protein
MRWVLALLAAAVVSALGYGVDAAAGAGEDALGPGIVRVPVTIEHSRFVFFDDDRTLTVRAGSIVELEVTNNDPIDHELIVGNDDVHTRHAGGTERFHPPVPGEVSVGAGDTGLTFYELDEPGTYDVVCHLPGHAEYGMVTEIRVVD